MTEATAEAPLAGVSTVYFCFCLEGASFAFSMEPVPCPCSGAIPKDLRFQRGKKTLCYILCTVADFSVVSFSKKHEIDHRFDGHFRIFYCVGGHLNGHFLVFFSNAHH